MDKSHKEKQGDEKASLWLKHVPIPRKLKGIEEIIRDSALPPEVLERSLVNIIFSLPPSSNACCRLLRSLPPSSLVWNHLQEGLLDGKCLPLEVLACFYESRLAFLEKEVFQVMEYYSQSACKRYELSDFTVEHFKDVGRCPSRLYGQKFDVDCEMNVDGSNRKIKNIWKTSCIVDAAIRSDLVFSVCLRLFFRIAVDSKFSALFVRIVHDFFSLLSHKLNHDIFKLFPAHLQHIVFLLTLPLHDPDSSILENDFEVQVTQEALLKVVKDEGIVIAQSLLSFFPFWFPSMSRNSFLDKYLSLLPEDDIHVT